jgi:hypothetical protein
MSINAFVASAAIAVALTGTIAGACKHPRARGTPEMSATPNSDSVRDSAVSAFSSNERISQRELGTALAAC